MPFSSYYDVSHLIDVWLFNRNINVTFVPNINGNIFDINNPLSNKLESSNLSTNRQNNSVCSQKYMMLKKLLRNLSMMSSTVIWTQLIDSCILSKWHLCNVLYFTLPSKELCCRVSAATRLYNPLRGAYYRSYECVLSAATAVGNSKV